MTPRTKGLIGSAAIVVVGALAWATGAEWARALLIAVSVLVLLSSLDSARGPLAELRKMRDEDRAELQERETELQAYREGHHQDPAQAFGYHQKKLVLARRCARAGDVEGERALLEAHTRSAAHGARATLKVRDAAEQRGDHQLEREAWKLLSGGVPSEVQTIASLCDQAGDTSSAAALRAAAEQGFGYSPALEQAHEAATRRGDELIATKVEHFWYDHEGRWKGESDPRA